MVDTVDLCWMQTLNGATEVLRMNIPMNQGLTMLAEEQRVQNQECKYGFGAVLFLRPSDDLFAAVARAMLAECREVNTPYEGYYRAAIALEDVWRVVRDQPDEAPRAELRKALIHVAAQALCAIEELKL